MTRMTDRRCDREPKPPYSNTQATRARRSRPSPGKLGQARMWVFSPATRCRSARCSPLRRVTLRQRRLADTAKVLGIQLTAFMTFLLICSSVTMVKGLRRSNMRSSPAAPLPRLTIPACPLPQHAKHTSGRISSSAAMALSGNLRRLALLRRRFSVLTGFTAATCRGVSTSSCVSCKRFAVALGDELQPGRDLLAVLAFRRSRLDPRLHVRVLSLGEGDHDRRTRRANYMACSGGSWCSRSSRSA